MNRRGDGGMGMGSLFGAGKVKSLYNLHVYLMLFHSTDVQPFKGKYAKWGRWMEKFWL
jgi:hypothetical protein